MSAHERWCHAHYRSYRPFNNTFLAQLRPRLRCFDPAGGPSTMGRTNVHHLLLRTCGNYHTIQTAK
ncbi:hypothetical protein HJB89_10980 [Rhizobium sp. NZLR8]|uniref:BA14K family protein n=1 Tax=Rhizobium sp. NZLR8 TaxID=2731104 RepID=UPI001C834B62|nr:hypothetical protein [Rhizobium sp. NZLR8]